MTMYAHVLLSRVPVAASGPDAPVLDKAPVKPSASIMRRYRVQYDDAERLWTTTVFPAIAPSDRADVQLLAAYYDHHKKAFAGEAPALPEGAGPHPHPPQPQDAADRSRAAGIASTRSAAGRDAALLARSRDQAKLVGVAMHELARQNALLCADRGALLWRIWSEHLEHFGKALGVVDRMKVGAGRREPVSPPPVALLLRGSRPPSSLLFSPPPPSSPPYNCLCSSSSGPPRQDPPGHGRPPWVQLCQLERQVGPRDGPQGERHLAVSPWEAARILGGRGRVLPGPGPRPLPPPRHRLFPGSTDSLRPLTYSGPPSLLISRTSRRPFKAKCEALQREMDVRLMAEKVLKDQLRWTKKEKEEAEEQSKFFEGQVRRRRTGAM